MQEPDAKALREYWLQYATQFLFQHMQQCGITPKPVRVSCGWPSSGGLGLRRVTIGQCFPPTLCKDGVQQIFISPRLADPVEVMATLLHELIHAALDCRFGHGKELSQAARKVGLAGPPTATHASEQLIPILLQFVQQVGGYPHAAIVPGQKQKKGSRLRLYECSCEPPIKVRVASDDFVAQCLRCGSPFALDQDKA